MYPGRQGLELGQGSQGDPQARPKVAQQASRRITPMMLASQRPPLIAVQQTPIRLSGGKQTQDGAKQK